MAYNTNQGLWFQVQNGAIVAGPFGGVEYPDQTTAAANGWFPGFAPNPPPAYNMAYYSLPVTYTLTGDVVTVSYGTPTPLALEQVQGAKIAELNSAYAASIVAPVIYNGKTFQADETAVANLTKMLLAFQASAAVPAGFYWVAEDNSQVPFTYADMQGLAQTIGVNGLTQFQHLQAKKAAVAAATTGAAVIAVTW